MFLTVCQDPSSVSCCVVLFVRLAEGVGLNQVLIVRRKGIDVTLRALENYLKDSILQLLDDEKVRANK